MREKWSQWRGVLLVLSAAFVWGWGGAVAKGLSLGGVDVLSLIFLRMLMCAVVGGVFFLWYDRSVFRLSPKQFLFLFVYGAFVVTGTAVGLFFCLKYMSVSSAMLLHYSFPIVTMLGSLFAVKETPTLPQVIAAALILLGVGTGVFVSPDKAVVPLPGILWGLLSVAGISMQTLCARVASKEGFIPQSTLLYHGFLWSTVNLAVCKSLTAGWGDIALIGGYEWKVITILGIGGTFLPHLFYFTGLRSITAPLGSLVSSFEMVAAVFFAMLLLREIPSFTEVAGSAIVLFAIGLASFSSDSGRKGVKLRLDPDVS